MDPVHHPPVLWEFLAASGSVFRYYRDGGIFFTRPEMDGHYHLFLKAKDLQEEYEKAQCWLRDLEELKARMEAE